MLNKLRKDDNNVLDNANALGDDANAVNEISVASLEFFVVPHTRSSTICGISPSPAGSPKA